MGVDPSPPLHGSSGRLVKTRNRDIQRGPPLFIRTHVRLALIQTARNGHPPQGEDRDSRMAGTGRPTGRPAKPIEQHRLNGNPSKKTLPNAPTPGQGLSAAIGIPNPPALGEHGLELWNHVWLAGKAWLSPDSDFTIIRLICEAHDEYVDLRSQLETKTVERFYTTANGQVVTHPVVTQIGNLRTQLTAWLAAIGFSPSDRSRLGLSEVRVRDGLDELKARRVDRATGT